MFEFSLGTHDLVRVWWNEQCPAGQLETAGSSIASKAKKSVVIEAGLPAGGRTLYGLLGFTWLSGSAAPLEVQFGAVGKQDEKLPTLALRIDDIVKGFADGFEDEIISTVGNRDELVSGLLECDHSAYSDLGSSVHMTNQLTEALIDLLLFDKLELERCQSVLRHRLNS